MRKEVPQYKQFRKNKKVEKVPLSNVPLKSDNVPLKDILVFYKKLKNVISKIF